jgi:hypothetical protein
MNIKFDEQQFQDLLAYLVAKMGMSEQEALKICQQRQRVV